MNDTALINISNRMKNDFYVGVVGAVRSGKSSFINSFFKQMILPYINDEFLKHKIVDELPQSAAGKQIMTVEPKFIPSTSALLELGDTKISIRLVDCVGEIIPSSEGYGNDAEPRLVKTPWFDDPIPFKEAASIGTEKVIYNHSNLGIYVTSDGTFGDFSREEYELVDDNLIPKIIELNKPFVIVLNTKNPLSQESIKLAHDLEEKWNVGVIPLSAISMTKDECIKVLNKALEEFPIGELNIMLPDYIEVLGEDIELKKSIITSINDIEASYKKVKDINNICNALRDTNIFNDVKLELMNASNGSANIKLELDDEKYNEIVESLLGESMRTKADFIEYLYHSKKANEIYAQVKNAIMEAKETGYGVSVPRLEDMKLITPEVVRKNGMYGIRLAAKAPVIHMIAVDLESSFTPIIGSEEQSNMLMSSLTESDDEKLWNTEFFGRKLCDIVNDSMKSKIHSLPDKSKEKIKGVLDKIMNSNHNNLIAIIL